MYRVGVVMDRLRTHGNTLVVVEHDPQVMVAADRIMDMGPGPGERGGQVVFDGTPAQLRNADTLTGNYLGSRLRVEAPRPMPVAANTPRLVLEGARANNLQNVSLRSKEHTSELQSLMRISYAVFCLKKKKYTTYQTTNIYKKQNNRVIL